MLRAYVTVQKTPSSSTTDRVVEPCLTRWPKRDNCTPYEILEQERGACYDKRRFYELVKVYHPDRWQHSTYHDISKATRVERYRLIVAANCILSDPVKRRAYDERGVGWDGGYISPSSTTSEQTNGSTESRRQHYNDVRGNATWEDWERWRHNGNNQRQEVAFICNKSFGLILVLFVAVGGCVQFARANHMARQVALQRDRIDRVISNDLWKIYQRNGESCRQSLIEAFLRRRSGEEYESI